MHLNSLKETLKATGAVERLSGLLEQKLDEKGRWIVPVDLRASIGVHFWLTIDHNSNMLVIPHQRWTELNEKWEKMLEDDNLDEFAIEAIERILTYAVEIKATRDWRIPVPELIRRKAGFKKDIVTVGSIDRLVVWDKERFLKAEERFDHPETLKRQRMILRGVLPQSRTRESEGDDGTASSYPGNGR